MRYNCFVLLICVFLSHSYAFDFSANRSYRNYGIPGITSKIYKEEDDIKSFDEIIWCEKPDTTGIVLEEILTKSAKICECLATNDIFYDIPYIESPQDSAYPCSAKMLGHYEAQRERKKQKCNQFIADWNADKYPCIFDSENVDKCREMLYNLYCNRSFYP